jgi:hypothetical protein
MGLLVLFYNYNVLARLGGVTSKLSARHCLVVEGFQPEWREGWLNSL